MNPVATDQLATSYIRPRDMVELSQLAFIFLTQLPTVFRFRRFSRSGDHLVDCDLNTVEASRFDSQIRFLLETPCLRIVPFVIA
jgi:hypothetical protein